MGVIDSVYIDMAVGSGKWFPEEGIMSLGVGGMGRVEILQLITGFRDGQGLPHPVDGGVRGAKPGESKDDVFSSTAHDIEEMFLGDPLDVGIEGAGVADCTGFVFSLVNIVDGNG